ncbi:MAG TPA: hypothetical protein DCL86_14320 [Bacteroidales bacterium]|jgi:hypothetical protein|nr:hypothetical protein [Bacteroidales bacterium]
MLVTIALSGFSQTTTNWTLYNDSDVGVEFSLPTNTIRYDTLFTILYAAAIDSIEAVQVHIFKDATFSNSEPIFNEALIQEDGDTLRAIAKLILLASNSEITELFEVFTNGIRGLEMGLTYKALQTDAPYHSFVRYYLIDGNFISFTCTGCQTNLIRGIATKNDFFNSIKF